MCFTLDNYALASYMPQHSNGYPNHGQPLTNIYYQPTVQNYAPSHAPINPQQFAPPMQNHAPQTYPQ